YEKDAGLSLIRELEEQGATLPRNNDPQRLIRAWEVLSFTGKPLEFWHTQKILPPEDLIFKTLFLLPERETLYENCNQRFLEMIKAGALDEVKAFRALNPPASLPLHKAIGVKEFSAYLDKEIPLEEAISNAQQATRRYAKRQMTWFRNQMKADLVLTSPHDRTTVTSFLAQR
ncbi:MAG: tRNA (adenosine(37)-N6)-dimethylallyltransferase, partial [Alphaproteobacteria bacterium]